MVEGHTYIQSKISNLGVNKFLNYSNIKKQQNKTKSLFCVEYAFDYFSSMINNNITSFDRQTDNRDI